MKTSRMTYLGAMCILAAGIATGQDQAFQKSTQKDLPITQADCFTKANTALTNNRYTITTSGTQVRGAKNISTVTFITCASLTPNQTRVTVLVTGQAMNASGLEGDHWAICSQMGIDVPLPTSDPPTSGGFDPPQANLQLDGPRITSTGMSTVAQCQAECAKNASCRAFSFIRPAGRPEGTGLCTQLRAPFTSYRSTCCDSGMRTGVTVGFSHEPGLTRGQQQEFRDPMSGGVFVDQCWTRGQFCGQEGADRYCSNVGWQLAASYQTTVTKATTIRVGDRSLCNTNCTYFIKVVCER